jgi:ankyrin repeat protein
MAHKECESTLACVRGDILFLTTNARFRWVELQIKYLCTLRKRSILLNRLERLPPGLQQIYEDLYTTSMDNMGEEQAEMTRKVLSWLLIAYRPLSTIEMIKLVCAPDEPDMSSETVLDVCFDFVRLEKWQDKHGRWHEHFRFSHLSVREFLESRRAEYSMTAMHTMATRECLYLVARSGIYIGEDYAVLYWLLHAEVATKSGVGPAIDELDHFLALGNRDFLWWTDIASTFVYHSMNKSYYSESNRDFLNKLQHLLPSDYIPLRTEDTLLCTLACFDFPDQLRRLMADLSSADHSTNLDTWRERAMYTASFHGNIANVRILLDAGVDIERSDRPTALQVASAEGHIEIVKLLLEWGANVDAPGDRGDTALLVASAEGHIEIVKLLLEWGANVDAQGNRGNTALLIASAEVHIEIVKLLLDCGAGVNAQVGICGNALQLAASRCPIEVVKLLLDYGADIQTQGGYYGSALQAAASRGSIGIVKLLLDRGADVHIQGPRYGAALQVASEHNNIDIVRLLTVYDVGDIGAPGGRAYGDALRAAVSELNVDSMSMLLAYDAEAVIRAGYATYEAVLTLTNERMDFWSQGLAADVPSQEYYTESGIWESIQKSHRIKEMLREHAAQASRRTVRQRRSRSCAVPRTTGIAHLRLSHSTSRYRKRSMRDQRSTDGMTGPQCLAAFTKSLASDELTGPDPSGEPAEPDFRLCTQILQLEPLTCALSVEDAPAVVPLEFVRASVKPDAAITPL